MSTYAVSNDKLIQRVLIWRAQKANPGLSLRGLAELLDVPETTVRRVVKLRENTPREMLEALEIEAVNAWRDALPIAGRKGDHRPAKDLLLHTKAIQPLADQQHAGVTILIGSVVMPGVSRAERDEVNGIPNVLDVSAINVIEACSAEPHTPQLAGADSREGDPDAAPANE